MGGPVTLCCNPLPVSDLMAQAIRFPSDQERQDLHRKPPLLCTDTLVQGVGLVGSGESTALRLRAALKILQG